MGQPEVTLIALVLAVVMTASGLGKIARSDRFRATLTTTYGWTAHFADVLAPAVPLIELGCAVLLVWPAARPLGLLVTSAVLIAMSALTATAWAGGRRGDCGCWGVVQEQLGVATVARDILLAVVSIAALAVGLR